MTFEEWEAKVNRIFLRYFGIGRDDFPDWLWFDAYTSGLRPQEAFEAWRDEYYEK